MRKTNLPSKGESPKVLGAKITACSGGRIVQGGDLGVRRNDCAQGGKKNMSEKVDLCVNKRARSKGGGKKLWKG